MVRDQAAVLEEVRQGVRQGSRADLALLREVHAALTCTAHDTCGPALSQLEAALGEAERASTGPGCHGWEAVTEGWQGVIEAIRAADYATIQVPRAPTLP